MNLRHAAALALVGWYLMVPLNNAGQVDPHAPLSSWHQWSAYDTAAQCEAAKAKEATDTFDRLEHKANSLKAARVRGLKKFLSACSTCSGG
jgi:mono/diheme cytochrome c family protein